MQASSLLGRDADRLWRARHEQRAPDRHPSAHGRRTRCRRCGDWFQRLELESLAAAFVGSFMVFVAHWLLELMQVLPPLDGLYYVMVMIGFVGSGADSAWQCLLRGGPSR